MWWCWGALAACLLSACGAQRDVASESYASSPKLGCAGVAACFGDCSAHAASVAEFQTCLANCQKRARLGSTEAFGRAYGCGVEHCLTDQGAGPRCVLAADGTTYLNGDGTPQGSRPPERECGTCVLNATARLFGYRCYPGVDYPACAVEGCLARRDCAPPACDDFIDTCLADP